MVVVGGAGVKIATVHTKDKKDNKDVLLGQYIYIKMDHLMSTKSPRYSEHAQTQTKCSERRMEVKRSVSFLKL